MIMKFGTHVLIRRGGHEGTTPGSFRLVKARYVGAHGHQVRCELEQDDPLDTVGWNRAGDVGWWARSAMTLAIDLDEGGS